MDDVTARSGPEVHETLLETARQLADECSDRAPGHDEADSFIAGIYMAMKAAGLVAAGVPAEPGGGGASMQDL